MTVDTEKTFSLQAVAFFVPAAAFTTVYITQPVLPVLESEFQADAFGVSLSVSAVILGIAIANIPLGALADRVAVHRILLVGGLMVAVCSLLAAYTHSLSALTGIRFVQGLFIPALTTCLAAYLARTLPLKRLNVVMGSYVSATVAGGLGGRLLGGWLHPPAHWRYAFVTAAFLVLVASLLAAWRLREPAQPVKHSDQARTVRELLFNPELFRILVVAFSSFFVFSSLFNYLPFHLSAEPFNLSTQLVTALYLAYVIGIFIGPIAGGMSNRFGSGLTIVGGACLFALALLLTLVPSLPVIAVALAAACAGYFAVHAAAVGALNRKVSTGRGRANALYVLFYYAGGTAGITFCGFAWAAGRWFAVVSICLVVLLVPVAIGIVEHRSVVRQAGRTEPP